MRQTFITALLICFAASRVPGQDFSALYNDSNSVKSQCYLVVCSDQLSAGIVKMSDFRFDSVTIGMSKIVPLKAKGVNWNLLFFRFIVKTHGVESLDYIFCYNQEYRRYYRVKSFRTNDLIDLFEYMKKTGLKLTEKNFMKEGIYVENVDMLCLLKFYKRKDESKIITDFDRQRFKCLYYHYQPVIINQK